MSPYLYRHVLKNSVKLISFYLKLIKGLSVGRHMILSTCDDDNDATNWRTGVSNGRTVPLDAFRSTRAVIASGAGVVPGCLWSDFITCLMSVIAHAIMTPPSHGPATFRRVQSDASELNWCGSVFDELTSGQAVTHYSNHRLTASVTTYAHACVNQWPMLARPACPLVSSLKTEQCQFSSV